MKQKKIFALLLVILSISLCACTFTPHVMPAVEETDQAVTALAESQSFISTQPLEMLDAITYVGIDDYFVPISYILDGKQVLSENARLYSPEMDSLLNDAPAVDELSQSIPVVNGAGLGPVISDGIWDFYPEEVDYQTYTLDKQPENSEWTTYFQEKLNGLRYDGPVIIQKSANVTCGDLDVSLVTASNVVTSGTEDGWATQSILETAQNPENANPFVYTISVLFVQGNAPVELFSHYYEITKEQKASPNGISYVPWGNEDAYLQFLSAVQFDSFGQAAEFPIFTDMTGELLLRDFRYHPRWLIADIDGDGNSEIIFNVTAASSSMCFCKVLEIEQGTVKEILHLNLG